LEYIEHLITSEKIDCHFVRSGRFRGAMAPEHYEAMARDMDDLYETVGVESYMVPKFEQHAEVGTDVFHGGSVLPNDASLHPGLYHAGLMRRVDEAGGQILGNAAVEAIAKEGEEFLVRSVRGEVCCRNVIVATNGYTDDLIPELG